MRAGDEISSTTYAPHAMHVHGVGSVGQGRAATNTQRRCLQWKQQRRARPTTRARRSHTHPRAHWTPHTSKLARTLYSRHEQGYAGPVAHTSVPLSTLTGSLTRFAHAQPDPEIVGDGHNAALTHDAARSQYKWTHSRAQPTTVPLIYGYESTRQYTIEQAIDTTTHPPSADTRLGERERHGSQAHRVRARRGAGASAGARRGRE